MQVPPVNGRLNACPTSATPDLVKVSKCGAGEWRGDSHASAFRNLSNNVTFQYDLNQSSASDSDGGLVR